MSYVKPLIVLFVRPSVRPSYFRFFNISTQPTLPHDLERYSSIYYGTPLHLDHISLNILHLRSPVAWDDINRLFSYAGVDGDKDDIVEVRTTIKTS